jgi:hypothetical protein
MKLDFYAPGSTQLSSATVTMSLRWHSSDNIHWNWNTSSTGGFATLLF